MTQNNPAVGFLPSHLKLGFRPGSFPLDALVWPLGQPGRLKGKCLRHLEASDHLVLPPRTTSYYRPYFGTKARISVMMLEPRIVQERHVPKLRRFHGRFHKVLSAVETDLIDQIPNGIFFPFGSTWVPEWETVDTAKSKLASLIASAKRSQPGHLIRHEIADWAKAEGIELDTLGRGYKPFAAKADGLAPYRFSVVIENAVEPSYFTEKLIDCLLCETVPIYWGCPDIARFLDPEGMIICQTADDIRRAVRSLSEELYEQKRPALLAMKSEAARFGAHQKRAAEILLSGAA
jgi:hypothetical protein